MSAEQDRRIQFYLNKINELPALPAIVLELTKVIDNPMSSVGEVEELMSRDQGLTLKVLKLANSAYYAIPGGAKNLMRAITFLGFGAVKQMVLTSTLFKMLDIKAENFNVEEFWKHSAGTAALAELVARRLKLDNPEDVFVCGLVHDMGKVLMSIVDPQGFSSVVGLAKAKGISYEDAERELSFPKHTLWGQELAKKWRLPVLIQAAVRDHHTERWGLRLSPAPDINEAVDSVYIANLIAHRKAFGEPISPVNSESLQNVLNRCKIDAQSLAAMDSEIDAALTNVQSLMDAMNG